MTIVGTTGDGGFLIFESSTVGYIVVAVLALVVCLIVGCVVFLWFVLCEIVVNHLNVEKEKEILNASLCRCVRVSCCCVGKRDGETASWRTRPFAGGSFGFRTAPQLGGEANDAAQASEIVMTQYDTTPVPANKATLKPGASAGMGQRRPSPAYDEKPDQYQALPATASGVSHDSDDDPEPGAYSALPAHASSGSTLKFP